MISLCTNYMPIWDNIKHGLSLKNIPFIETQKPKTKRVACWGWRKGQELRAKGHEVLVFERGYIGDRFYYTSIGWNGLNGHADFCLNDNHSHKLYQNVKDWHDGEYIIIMGQVNGDASLRGQCMTKRYEEWGAEAENFYKMPVYFRPHPHTDNGNFKPNLPVIDGDLGDVFQKCHLAICYNSNSSVDAVLNGVPCITFDIGSMAYDVTGQSICDRIKPARKDWISKVLNCQWEPNQISNGDYLERMWK